MVGFVFLYTFGLLEFNGVDWCDELLEKHKAKLEKILAKADWGMRFTEHLEGDGKFISEHACKLGLEGIVSKRKGSRYRSGRSPHWHKSKNPTSPAGATGG